MMFDNLIPYTDLHELNLDWIIKKVKETMQKTDDLETFFYDDVKKSVDKYIADNLAYFLLNVMYDENTEAIIFKREDINNG